ncbi:MAG: hypothetical protein K1X28_06015 [Parachlamydiales bacterium]|nr:hypothetical protein [Parachlamydiales bacterium]
MNEAPVKQQSWLQLLSIQTPAAVCLPNIIAGQILCEKYGWLGSSLAIILGNLFLIFIGILFSLISTRLRQTTPQHAAYYFGNRGNTSFALLMITAMLLWFGIQLDTMNLSLQELTHTSLSPLFLNLSMSLLITLATLKGIKALKWLSNLIAPLLFLTLLIALFWSHPGQVPPSPPLSFSWLKGASLIVGCNIAGAIDIPTFFRHAKTEKDGKICIIFLFGLLVPLIQCAGVYLSTLCPNHTILQILQPGLGPIWMGWICSFVILSGLCINNLNLYSAIASSYSLPIRLHFGQRAFLFGLIGAAIGLCSPLKNIVFFLDLIAILIGGMGAVILSNFLFDRRNGQFPFSLVSWSLGCIAGILSTLFPSLLTGVPVFETFLIALISQLAINLYLSKQPQAL